MTTETNPAGWVPTEADALEARRIIKDTQRDAAGYLLFLGALVAAALFVTMDEVSRFYVHTLHMGPNVARLPDLIFNIGLIGTTIFEGRAALRPGYRTNGWVSALRYVCAGSVVVLNSYMSIFPTNQIRFDLVNPGGLLGSLLVPAFLFVIAEVIAGKITSGALTIASAKTTIRDYEAERQRQRRAVQEQAQQREAEEREAAAAAQQNRQDREAEKLRRMEEEAAEERRLERLNAAAERQAQVKLETLRVTREADRDDLRVKEEAAAAGRARGEAEAEALRLEAERLKAETAEAEARAERVKAETEAFTAAEAARRENERVLAEAQAKAVEERAKAARLKSAARAGGVSSPSSRERPTGGGVASQATSRPASSEGRNASQAASDDVGRASREAFKALFDTDREGALRLYGPSVEDFKQAVKDGLNLDAKLREWAMKDAAVLQVGGPGVKLNELAAMYGKSPAWMSARATDARNRLSSDERFRTAIEAVALEGLVSADQSGLEPAP